MAFTPTREIPFLVLAIYPNRLYCNGMRNDKIKSMLREVVKDAGTSQRQLAFAVDMDPSDISNMVARKPREPLVGTAIKIARALGCAVEDIWDIEEAA